MDLKWWHYVIFAGLAWGVYVPLIFFGGSALGSGKALPSHRLMAILCVGIAYFFLAVVIPTVIFSTSDACWPSSTKLGLIFSGLAGVAGAVGAICVVFASSSAVAQAKAEGAVTPEELARYRMFIAPLIFACAPLINTLVSLVWHPDPKTGDWFHFGFTMPDKVFVGGIVLIGLGVGLVLYSKEAGEAKANPKPQPVPVEAGEISPPAGS